MQPGNHHPSTRSSFFTRTPQNAERAIRLLEHAAPLLRLPTSPTQIPEVMQDGSGLHCPETGRIYPYSNGVLNLLVKEPALTDTQQLLNTRFSAWAYDRFRTALLKVARTPSFPDEVAAIQRHLAVQPGDTVLDLACGHGVFTMEWAKRVGPDGLVLGLDLSPAMLRRAAIHMRQWDLENVLLIRGDALHLPFTDGILTKVNCSGGFHQLPDLPRALDEIARVSTATAVLTASTFAEAPQDRYHALKVWAKRRFAFHSVPLEWLGRTLQQHGYTDYVWSLDGGWFGYTAAYRTQQEAV